MPMPQMRPVVSSNIASVGYDPGSEELYITFKGSGRTYKYLQVPPGEFAQLERAESVGSYFANNIKDQYKTTPI